MKIISNEEYNRLENGFNAYEKVIKHIANLEKELSDKEKDTSIILARKEAELDVKISEALKENRENIQNLTIENANYKKEVEILTKAFENMGFDVKDMKEILNKLVDGIVSGNKVNIIK
jgi:uncharacterized protein (UPF0335 family)